MAEMLRLIRGCIALVIGYIYEIYPMDYII